MKKKAMNRLEIKRNDSPSHQHDYRCDQSGQEDKATERAEGDDWAETEFSAVCRCWWGNCLIIIDWVRNIDIGHVIVAVNCSKKKKLFEQFSSNYRQLTDYCWCQQLRCPLDERRQSPLGHSLCWSQPFSWWLLLSLAVDNCSLVHLRRDERACGWNLLALCLAAGRCRCCPPRDSNQCC